MLTLKEVAFIVGREATTLQRWNVKGIAIPVYTKDGKKAIHGKDLIAYLEGYKRKKLDPTFFSVQAFKNGACIWSGKRRGSIKQIKEALKIYPSLKNCKLFFEEV